MTRSVVVLILATVVWVGFEVWLVVRDRMQGKGGTGTDRGTRYMNFAAITVGIAGAALCSGMSMFLFHGGRSEIVFCGGLGIMAMGLALRIWAVAALGASFRTTVGTHEGQRVVQTGPYRLIRHPSYSGLLVMCCGYGVAVQNWLSLLIAVVLPFMALAYRMRIEERALTASMGTAYEEYMRKTRRLVPFVW